MTTITYELARTPGRGTYLLAPEYAPGEPQAAPETEQPSLPAEPSWHIVRKGGERPLCQPPQILTTPERLTIDHKDEVNVCAVCQAKLDESLS